MPRFKAFTPKGVIPACLLPFHEDLSIDETAYRAHLRDVVAVDGLSAITINAHSTEVSSCSFEEQRRIMDITMDEVGDRIPVVHGVYHDGSHEAARIARMADELGASCLLVFPPHPLIMGGQMRPEMALAHFKTIADASDLPIIAFQYPLAGGQGYPMDTLLRLVDEVPRIQAIKDWCNLVPQHERHIRVLQNLPRPVNVLTTHSAWMLSSLVLGCNGLLSGAGSVIADLQVALFRAVQNDDLATAKRVYDQLYPVTEAFYADPFVDMHNRMKVCLALLGRIPRSVVRPPLVKLSDDETARLGKALAAAGIQREGALLHAA